MESRIIIIGASLSGLYTALALSSKGIKSLLVEKRTVTEDKIEDNRAIAIAYGSKEILEEIDIWDDLQAVAGKIDRIIVTEGLSPLFLNFDHDCSMGFIVQCSNLLKVAIKKVKNDKNITLLDNSTYEIIENNQDLASIKINDVIYRSELIIGADGKYSQLRSLCNIKIKEKDYHQHAIICNLSHKIPHKNTAYEMFQASGPIALLPLHKPNESGLVWTENPQQAANLTNMNKDEFCYFINSKIEDILGKVEVISDISSYPLKLIMAEKYFHNHICLIGDAAHAIHPIAGQGFNLGIQDIDSLANLLAKYNRLGMNLGCYQLLSEYEKTRKRANRRMAIITDTINKLFSNDLPAVGLVRKIGLAAVNKLPLLKKFFVSYAMAKKH